MEKIPNSNKEDDLEIENSPLKEAYLILNASNPLELSRLYTAEDQVLMKSNLWDYDNPNLVVNKIKELVEQADWEQLSSKEQQWAQEILWFWYHHAISCAIKKQDKKLAKKYATKALELQDEGHPNKITQLLYYLVNDNLKEAELWLASIAIEPEKSTAAELVGLYKKDGFFKRDLKLK
ncbi:MAG: hypothetical protein AAB821_00120 [Patescibacteria group bacterium]